MSFIHFVKCYGCLQGIPGERGGPGDTGKEGQAVCTFFILKYISCIFVFSDMYDTVFLIILIKIFTLEVNHDISLQFYAAALHYKFIKAYII